MAVEQEATDPTAASSEPLVALIRNRLGDQAAGHWREFAAITASGGILIVIGTTGLLFTRSIAIDALVMLGAMLFVTLVAFVLAYYSMQVGALTLVGPLTPSVPFG